MLSSQYKHHVGIFSLVSSGTHKSHGQSPHVCELLTDSTSRANLDLLKLVNSTLICSNGFRYFNLHSSFSKGLNRTHTFPYWVVVSVYCGTVKASSHPSHSPLPLSSSSSSPKKPQTTHIPLAPATSEFRSAEGVTELL